MKTEYRVHIVHWQSSPGGIELLIPSLVKNMHRKDFRIFVIRPPEPSKVNIYETLNELLVTYGARNNFSAFFKLFLYTLKNRKDIFHLFNAGPFILCLLRLAGIKKIVYSIRGTKYWNKPWQNSIRKLSWILGLTSNVRIIANSGFSRSIFLTEISDRYSVEVVYNPVYSAVFYPESEKKTTKELTIIYVGRLVKNKNLYKWLDIAASIKRNFNNTLFNIYGDGPVKNELMAYVEKLQLETSVKFFGFTNDTASAYLQADLMLFLSEYESFGNVVVESILFGTPVIASAIPSMKEIFRNYPDFMVALDDNLEEKVLNKIGELDNLKSLVPAVAAEFKERFSMKLHTEKLEAIYDSFNMHS